MSKLAHQVSVMLDMQSAMNRKVNLDWRAQNFEWYRAVWVECAEMLDHYGWKWWKKQIPDIPQVQLELIDIFHFGLSSILQNQNEIDSIATKVAEALTQPAPATDFKYALESLASEALTNKFFDLHSFSSCIQLVGMSTDELFKQYVGKNTLNFFRQDHGYQEGTYHKVWYGREDNEYLVDILNGLSADLPDFQEQVYHGLEANYPST